MAGTDAQRVVNGLLGVELDQRVDAFERTIKALNVQIERWSMLAEFVMFDTSVYIQHPQKLDELDVASLLEARDQAVHLLVPIVVVDELDSLKKSKEGPVRTRARKTLAVLDRLFETTTAPTQLRAPDSSALASGGTPRGEVTIEIVFDPPGHVRLPINDDEIVDRALAIEPLAARQVRLVTYDTGQSMRARAQDLRVVKLTKPLEEEPPNTTSTKRQ